MNNLSKKHYESLDIDKQGYFIDVDDAKFTIAYWYGQAKAHERIHLLNDKDIEYSFLTAYDTLIRTLYVSGMSRKKITPFIIDYASCLHGLIKTRLEDIDLRLIEVNLNELILMLHYCHLEEYKERIVSLLKLLLIYR